MIPPPAVLAAFQPLPVGATVTETVNALIDDLLALGNRLLELPLFMLVPFFLLVCLGVAWGIGRIFRRRNRSRVGGIILIAEGFLALLAIAFAADLRTQRLEVQLATERSQTAAVQEQLAKAANAGSHRPLLFDESAAQSALATHFGDLKIQARVYDEATDYVEIHARDPLLEVYLAVVDIENPSVRITLGTQLDRKTLTSDFARTNGCSVAINGEAGLSPRPRSGLGPWRGNLVYQGKVIAAESSSRPLPYLVFDRNNRADYVAQSTGHVPLAADAYNVIWGRWDALIHGEVQTQNERNRQPRTAMGINGDGTKLYLLVADGRQPTLSVGLTRAEVGIILKAFGAEDGMLCDEGGSSTIYLEQLGGVANSPSDGHGRERPTYTHFGISLLRGSALTQSTL